MGKPINKDMKEGSVHKARYGNLVIVKYINSGDVTVRFVDTGHTRSTRTSNIRTGTVKDPLARSVQGVGCIGVGPYNAIGEQYSSWLGMITRCYSKKKAENKPNIHRMLRVF